VTAAARRPRALGAGNELDPRLASRFALEDGFDVALSNALHVSWQ